MGLVGDQVSGYQFILHFMPKSARPAETCTDNISKCFSLHTSTQTLHQKHEICNCFNMFKVLKFCHPQYNMKIIYFNLGDMMDQSRDI